MNIQALVHTGDRESPLDQVVSDDVTPDLIEHHPRKQNEDRLRELAEILAILNRKHPALPHTNRRGQSSRA